MQVICGAKILRTSGFIDTLAGAERDQDNGIGFKQVDQTLGKAPGGKS